MFDPGPSGIGGRSFEGTQQRRLHPHDRPGLAGDPRRDSQAARAPEPGLAGTAPGMGTTITKTPQAQRDLLELADSIAQGSLDAAQRFLDAPKKLFI